MRSGTLRFPIKTTIVLRVYTTSWYLKFSRTDGSSGSQRPCSHDTAAGRTRHGTSGGCSWAHTRRRTDGRDGRRPHESSILIDAGCAFDSCLCARRMPLQGKRCQSVLFELLGSPGDLPRRPNVPGGRQKSRGTSSSASGSCCADHNCGQRGVRPYEYVTVLIGQSRRSTQRQDSQNE